MRKLNKKYWVQHVTLEFDDKKINQAIKWCKETFTGQRRWIVVGASTFYFRDSGDATFFMLKWS